MNNKRIIGLIKSTVNMMELHGVNDFKIRSYNTAIQSLENHNSHLEKLDTTALEKISGVGKSMASKIDEINNTGELTLLNEYIDQTPEGIIEMTKYRGLGSKKIRTLWQEHGMESLEDLENIISSGTLEKAKGFGKKGIENLKKYIVFVKKCRGYVHYSVAEKIYKNIESHLKSNFDNISVAPTGKLRRKWEVVNDIAFVVSVENFSEVESALLSSGFVSLDLKKSGPSTIRGIIAENKRLNFTAYLCSEDNFIKTLLIKTGSKAHLGINWPNGSLLQTLANDSYTREQDVYAKAGVQYCEPELREGTFEAKLASDNNLPKLVEMEDLKGILHNHSNYSDGAYSLEEMAMECQTLGYDYLGISDHSKAAHFYANGLFENRVKEQHLEIDALNQKMAPFKIFKGIEADILADGALDYESETLASFDFVVASIHSGLSMDKEKATQRLITAIANPYTTILGHMTGRLLLMREGYPIDHEAIINACAKFGVIIEINAHPYRLDIDWRWVRKALDKGVILSINPDAHETEGYKDMYYGLCVGRKGGLTKEQTFNAWSLAEVEAYFNKRKAAVKN